MDPTHALHPVRHKALRAIAASQLVSQHHCNPPYACDQGSAKQGNWGKAQAVAASSQEAATATALPSDGLSRTEM